MRKVDAKRRSAIREDLKKEERANAINAFYVVWGGGFFGFRYVASREKTIRGG